MSHSPQLRNAGPPVALFVALLGAAFLALTVGAAPSGRAAR